jgi:hypothetical protein
MGLHSPVDFAVRAAGDDIEAPGEGHGRPILPMSVPCRLSRDTTSPWPKRRAPWESESFLIPRIGQWQRKVVVCLRVLPREDPYLSTLAPRGHTPPLGEEVGIW